MPESGAELAGIQKGDMIIAVDGVPYDQNNPDMPSTRGEANSTVNITILRGSDEILEIPVTRVNFTGGAVRSARYDDTYVITFKSFEEMSDAEDFERFYDEAAADPTITKLVIDLRDNGGGFVNVLDAMLSVLTPKAMPLYSYESKYERIEIFSDGVYKGAGKKFDGTLFVLTNENTASCGDMMTAIIKNIGGIQVGTPTYGKGIVQSNPDMHNYHVLTITSHHTVVPNYGRTHGKPYIPDVDMPELVSAYKPGEVYSLSDTVTPITEDSPIVRIKAYQQLLASAYSKDLGIEITGKLDAKTMLITNEFRRQLGFETSDELIIDTKTLKEVYKEGKADIVEDQLINSKTDKGMEYILNYVAPEEKAA
jgi:C-terminal processing protease CtpA/Prc